VRYTGPRIDNVWDQAACVRPYVHGEHAPVVHDGFRAQLDAVAIRKEIAAGEAHMWTAKAACAVCIARAACAVRASRAVCTTIAACACAARARRDPGRPQGQH
jgi:hypothetical protein